MDTRLRTAAAALCIVLFCASARAQQAFTVEQLLDRTTAYVEDLMTKFSRVVAEEQYTQEYLIATPQGSRGSFPGAPKTVERRVLKSDLLMVRPAGLDQWFIFRDVFEVDARPVRDRENRLARLFLETRDSVTAIERAHEIATASAQFNVRPMGTVDNPMLALGFLQRVYRPRFRFTLRGRDAAAGPDMWIVEYRETARPTLMRGTDNCYTDDRRRQLDRVCEQNKDIFARGRYWIDAASGRIARTEVVFSSLGTESRVTTSFQMDERLGAYVPVEMNFKRGGAGNEVRATATYGRFRQFEVGTEEAIRKSERGK
jgi:hypothetical protein